MLWKLAGVTGKAEHRRWALLLHKPALSCTWLAHTHAHTRAHTRGMPPRRHVPGTSTRSPSLSPRVLTWHRPLATRGRWASLFDKPCFLAPLALSRTSSIGGVAGVDSADMGGTSGGSSVHAAAGASRAVGEGADTLTHMHGNTHVPVALGALHRHEVTGEPIFRLLSEQFLSILNTTRTFATGGTTHNEVWGAVCTPQGPNLESRSSWSLRALVYSMDVVLISECVRALAWRSPTGSVTCLAHRRMELSSKSRV